MRSRGAATVNEARKPGIPSGRFTASTTTSPAKSAAQSLPATGSARNEEHPQHQEGHTRCTPGPPHRLPSSAVPTLQALPSALHPTVP